MGANRQSSALLAVAAGLAAGALVSVWWARPWTWVWLDAVPVEPAAQGRWLGAIVATAAAAIGTCLSPGSRLLRTALAVLATGVTLGLPLAAPAAFARGAETGSGAVVLATVVAFGALGAAIRPGPVALGAAAAAAFGLSRIDAAGATPVIAIAGGLGAAWIGTRQGARLVASVGAALAALGALGFGLATATATADPDAPPFGPIAAAALVDTTLALHPAPRRVLIVGARDPRMAIRAILGGAEAVDVVATPAALERRIADATTPIANRRGTHLGFAAAPDAPALLARRGAFDVVIDCRPTPGLDAFDALDADGRYAWWTRLDAPFTAACATALRALDTRAPGALDVWGERVVSAQLLGCTVARSTARPDPWVVRPTRSVVDPIDAIARRRGDAALVARILDADGERIADRVAAATDGQPGAWPPAPDALRDRAAAAVALVDRLRAIADDPLDARARAIEDAIATIVAEPFGRRAIDRTARALAASGDRTRADALYRSALAIRGDWLAGRLGRARLAADTLATTGHTDDWAKVNTVLERVVFHDPDNAEAWRLHGVALLRARADAAGARTCFENAYSLDPTDAETQSHLWRYLLADDRPDEALAMLIEASRALPDRAWIRDTIYKLAPQFLVMSRVDLATRALSAVREHYRDDAGYLLVRSRVREADGDLAGAIEDARRCAALSNPPVQGYFLHLYRLLARSDRTRERDEVRTFMQRTFSIDPATIAQ